jgi:MFS family permease
VIAVSSVAQGIFVVLFVVFVIRVLHGGASEVGLLRGVQAIGALIGGMLLAPLGHRLAPRRLAGAGMLAFGLVDLAIWNGPSLTTQQGLYVGLFIAAGIPGIAAVTGLASLVQANTPDQFRGRIFSAYFTVSDGFQALGMLLAGLLADPIGLLPVLNGQAALYLLAGLLALTVLTQSSDRRRPTLASVTAGPIHLSEKDQPISSGGSISRRSATFRLREARRASSAVRPGALTSTRLLARRSTRQTFTSSSTNDGVLARSAEQFTTTAVPSRSAGSSAVSSRAWSRLETSFGAFRVGIGRFSSSRGVTGSAGRAPVTTSPLSGIRAWSKFQRSSLVPPHDPAEAVVGEPLQLVEGMAGLGGGGGIAVVEAAGGEVVLVEAQDRAAVG